MLSVLKKITVQKKFYKSLIGQRRMISITTQILLKFCSLLIGSHINSSLLLQMINLKYEKKKEYEFSIGNLWLSIFLYIFLRKILLNIEKEYQSCQNSAWTGKAWAYPISLPPLCWTSLQFPSGPKRFLKN